MASLDGYVAIVTGAAGGMGGGITRRFVREGATVVCVDKVDSAERVAELEQLRPGPPRRSSWTCAISPRSSGWSTTSSNVTAAST